jgi:hypothetical protein
MSPTLNVTPCSLATCSLRTLSNEFSFLFFGEELGHEDVQDRGGDTGGGSGVVLLSVLLVPAIHVEQHTAASNTAGLVPG